MCDFNHVYLMETLQLRFFFFPTLLEFWNIKNAASEKIFD